MKTRYVPASGGSGRAADAIAADLGGSAGLFAFDSGNPELLVRIVNACSTSSYWTVYAGAASPRAFSSAVRDTETNELKWFHARGGQPVADVEAFPCTGTREAPPAPGPPPAPEPPRGSDRSALVALYNVTDGPNWVDNTNWLTDAPLGEWYGVQVDAAGRVVGISLNSRWDSDAGHHLRQGLRGRIPPELSILLSTLGKARQPLRDVPEAPAQSSRSDVRRPLPDP